MRLLDQKSTAPHTRAGMRGGCSPQNNLQNFDAIKPGFSQWQQISLGLAVVIATRTEDRAFR